MSIPVLLKGDTLGIYLDRRKLTFSINGVCFSSPFAPERHLVTTGFVQLGVQFMSATDQIVLLSEEASPDTMHVSFFV